MWYEYSISTCSRFDSLLWIVSNTHVLLFNISNQMCYTSAQAATFINHISRRKRFLLIQNKLSCCCCFFQLVCRWMHLWKSKKQQAIIFCFFSVFLWLMYCLTLIYKAKYYLMLYAYAHAAIQWKRLFYESKKKTRKSWIYSNKKNTICVCDIFSTSINI